MIGSGNAGPMSIDLTLGRRGARRPLALGRPDSIIVLGVDVDGDVGDFADLLLEVLFDHERNCAR